MTTTNVKPIILYVFINIENTQECQGVIETFANRNADVTSPYDHQQLVLVFLYSLLPSQLETLHTIFYTLLPTPHPSLPTPHPSLPTLHTPPLTPHSPHPTPHSFLEGEPSQVASQHQRHAVSTYRKRAGG